MSNIKILIYNCSKTRRQFQNNLYLLDYVFFFSPPSFLVVFLFFFYFYSLLTVSLTTCFSNWFDFCTLLYNFVGFPSIIFPISLFSLTIFTILLCVCCQYRCLICYYFVIALLNQYGDSKRCQLYSYFFNNMFSFFSSFFCYALVPPFVLFRR